MRQKLGLLTCSEEADDRLIARLFECMQQSGVDMHVTFRSLALVPMPSTTPPGTSPSHEPGKEFLKAVLDTSASPEAVAASLRSAMDPRQLQLLQHLASASPMTLMSLGISLQV